MLVLQVLFKMTKSFDVDISILSAGTSYPSMEKNSMPFVRLKKFTSIDLAV